MKDKIILLVEDSPDGFGLTKHKLVTNRIGNEIITINNGQEALDYLFAKGQYSSRDVDDLPAVVLLDFKLPLVNGLDVLRQIRADKRIRDLPVVILTTSEEEDTVVQNDDLQANGFIRKPIELKHLLKVTQDLGFSWTLTSHPPPKK